MTCTDTPRLSTAVAPTGATRLFPVVGSPVAQVQAPAMFNPRLAAAGLDALVVALELPPAQVVEACGALLRSASIGGLLVTVPYKQTLLALADELGDEARAVGAVNALRRGADGRIHGELFDGLGFVAGLRAAGHEPAGQRVLLLGAGGAGSAIASALERAGAQRLGVFDPRPGAANALARTLHARFPACETQALQSPDARGCTLVVNASPLGMRAGDPLPLDAQALDAGTLVAEVVMQPAVTPLLHAAAARGLPTHAGRAMLEHQVDAYLDFFGLRPPAGALFPARMASPIPHQETT